MPHRLSTDELWLALAGHCLDEVPDVSEWMEDDLPESSCETASYAHPPPRP